MQTAALVLGIISLVISIGGGAAGLGWVGSICGILAIVFGAIGMKAGGDQRKTAKTGKGGVGTDHSGTADFFSHVLIQYFSCSVVFADEPSHLF